MKNNFKKILSNNNKIILKKIIKKNVIIKNFTNTKNTVTNNFIAEVYFYNYVKKLKILIPRLIKSCNHYISYINGKNKT